MAILRMTRKNYYPLHKLNMEYIMQQIIKLTILTILVGSTVMASQVPDNF